MGTSSANWRGIIHRNGGATVGVSVRFHFGTYGVDTPEAPEISYSDAMSIHSACSGNDAALNTAVLATGWASWWTTTQAALANAPAGTLCAACRDFFDSVTF